MGKFIIPALRTFLLGGSVLGLLLFLPAGTLIYWQAWVFIIVFMVAVNALGIYLSLHDPELLERRKRVGPAAEQKTAQKIIVSLLIIGCIAVLLCSALDHRFGWSHVPAAVALLGDGLVLLGLLICYFVLRENRFGSSTVQIMDGQHVISTGPYALVRHPMYVGTLIMIAGVPIALGSWWGLVLLALIIPVLIWRILDEEQLLAGDLPGYREYTRTVRYRLVPYVW